MGHGFRGRTGWKKYKSGALNEGTERGTGPDPGGLRGVCSEMEWELDNGNNSPPEEVILTARVPRSSSHN